MKLAYWMYAGPAHIGTLRVASSFKNVHAIMHAPLGDDYFNVMRSMLERERDFTPVTTSIVDRHVLTRGSQEKVVKNITRKEKEERPDLILLTPTCTSSILQEDLQNFVNRAAIKSDSDILLADVNHYRVNELQAADRTLEQIVRFYIQKKSNNLNQKKTEKPSCNIIGIFTLGFHNMHDSRELKRLLNDLGIQVNQVIPQGGSVTNLKDLPKAWFNVIPYREVGLMAGNFLEKECGMPYVSITPMGLLDTASFIREIAKILKAHIAKSSLRRTVIIKKSNCSHNHQTRSLKDLSTKKDPENSFLKNGYEEPSLYDLPLEKKVKIQRSNCPQNHQICSKDLFTKKNPENSFLPSLSDLSLIKKVKRQRSNCLHNHQNCSKDLFTKKNPENSFLPSLSDLSLIKKVKRQRSNCSHKQQTRSLKDLSTKKDLGNSFPFLSCFQKKEEKQKQEKNDKEENYIDQQTRFVSQAAWFSRSIDCQNLTGKKAIVFGDATHAASMTKILTREMGIKVSCAGTYCKHDADWFRENVKGFCDQVLITDDHTIVGDIIARIEPAAIFGTQMERHIGKRLDIPCGVISAPVHIQNFPLGYRPFLGYEGTNQIADLVYNSFTLGMEDHLLEIFGGHDTKEVITKSLSTDSDSYWGPDGLAELNKIPGFVRGKIKRNTERFARENGFTEITAEVMYAAKEAAGA